MHDLGNSPSRLHSAQQVPADVLVAIGATMARMLCGSGLTANYHVAGSDRTQLASVTGRRVESGKGSLTGYCAVRGSLAGGTACGSLVSLLHV
jgi:hypothetical protein